jgi:hypothetical protein
VIIEGIIDGAEVDLVVEQMVQRVLERVGQQLSFEVLSKEARTGVDLPIADNEVLIIC